MKVVRATFTVAGENPPPLALTDSPDNPKIKLNRHLFKMDTSVKWTPRVGPFFSLLPLIDSLQNGHLELVPAFLYSLYLTLYKTDT